MTDKQIVDIVLRRAIQNLKSINASASDPRIVITQQFNKRLYFNIICNTNTTPHILTPIPMAFCNGTTSMVFVFPELPERLMEWKRQTIKNILSKPFGKQYLDFDIETFPKEIVHIFSSAIISALNSPNMSILLLTGCISTLFKASETYEEVSIESDMMLPDGGFQ